MRSVRDTIAAHQNEILRLWVQVIRESAFAEELSPVELTGVIPDFLGSLGRIALDGPVQLQDGQRDLLDRHMSNRLRQGSTLNEILTEFSVLARILAWFIDRDGGDTGTTAREVASLFAELNAASVASMKIFNEHLLEDEQPIKRYLRLLQNLAGSGEILASTAPLRLLMTEALSLIGQATGARTAALRLVDPRSERLILTASAGEAAELVERFVGSREAEPGEASGEDGAGSGEIATDDSLRAAGIQSLLAVRLSSRHALRGVLYVAVRDGRAMAPGDIRQIEALGEALTIHLDHAQVCSALRAKAEEAVAECLLRERFVSMLMHDLAGPLAAARALLAGGAGDPAVAARVVEELDRMEEMVDALLDAHRIRAGQPLPMNITRCDLGVLVRDVVGELRAPHGDRFIVEADAGVCGMWSADQLRRAFWNLASNALKFGASDAPVLIRVRRNAESAELLVHNDGPSIPSDEQAELFRPFALPHAGRGHPRGWGLGLTLVWGCADAHGGRVDVDSAPGQGTTFKLAIPFDARPYVT